MRGSLFDGIVYDQTGERVLAWSVDAWSGAVLPLFDRPDVRASTVAAASKASARRWTLDV
jgi:hypothetical protein